jgi:RIO-like serine/threonine protein kinase
MSDRASRNQRKAEILQFVADNVFVEALEASISLGISPQNASTRLGTFYKWGLLTRQKTHGKTFGYSITNRGLDRLAWLNEN